MCKFKGTSVYSHVPKTPAPSQNKRVPQSPPSQNNSKNNSKSGGNGKK